MISLYAFYALLFLWVIHALQRVFFCLYFWQVKEYRFDRIKGDLKRSSRVFVPKASILMLVVLFFLAAPQSPNSQYSWDDLVLVVFCALGIYSFILLVKKRWKMPKFTKKALVLSVLSVIVLAYTAIIFFDKFFLFVVIAEIVIPFVTFAIAELLQMPTFFIKRIIYKKAERKIEEHKNLIVVGITGSYGKSSMKEFLYTILSKKYNVLKTSGNTNTEIGVAQIVNKYLTKDHQVFIAEMAAYRKGEIKLLCNIVKPKIGIVAGVNEQHLALFGSMENLLLSEGGGELATALPKDGMLVLNGDNKYCLDLFKKTGFQAKKRIYSLSNKKIDSDIWPEDIAAHKDRVSFLATNKNKDLANFNVKVLGRQNVQNLLGAILVANELGMSFGEISDACEDIRQEQTGMISRRGKLGIDIIDSSYSANPDGVSADLDYLSIYPNKKVIVMPCLIELGDKSKEIHEKIGRKIGEVCDSAIITSKDYFKEIERGFNETKKEGAKCILCDKPKDIYAAITLFCESGDEILLEGRVPAGLINLLVK